MDEKSGAEKLWESLANHSARGRERAAFNLAVQNADDTAVQEHFDTFAPRWFEIFASTFDFNMDCMDDDSVEAWDF